jgi:predicted RNase H-like nuclease (RuvC/YqgF family)
MAAVAIGVWAYFGVTERITMLETKSQLAEKDVNQAVERLESEQTKNSEFRIKWPRGELGSPPADSEQFMLIEHIAGQVEKIQNRMEDMMNNGVNITRLQQDVKDLRADVEKLKDEQRSLKSQNGQ